MFARIAGVTSRLRTCMSDRHQMRCFSSSKYVNTKGVWDLFSAVCVERRPVLTTSLTDIELQFQKFLEDIEYENSFKSDHEIKKEKERMQAELLKKGELDSDFDIALKTIQDFEDAYQEEFSKFQCAQRITEADQKHTCLRSLDRSLEKYLVLVINQKVGDAYKWILPQGIRENGETLRQTAERVLVEMCGAHLQTKFLGNAPCGFYKYKYPKTLQKDSIGAKVFFFKAWHLSGQVECSKSLVKDFRWSCTQDLRLTFENEVYHNSISQFLITQ